MDLQLSQRRGFSDLVKNHAGVDGEVMKGDVDNYLVMMKLRSQNGIGMMDKGIMNP